MESNSVRSKALAQGAAWTVGLAAVLALLKFLDLEPIPVMSLSVAGLCWALVFVNALRKEQGECSVAKSILAVDDSASVRQMVSYTLKSAGYEVIEAADGEDALAKAKTKAIDLILTDQNMPNMDGLTLVRSLRRLPGYRIAPILILTTESSDAMKSQGRTAGATGWLVKPFDPQRLLEVVRKVIG